MTPRLCVYKCGTMLEGWDDDARKYKEAGTGGLHTKERCQEAKAKLATKDDHGNEQFKQKDIGEPVAEGGIKYVDHTLKGQSKVKFFIGASARGRRSIQRIQMGNSWKNQRLWYSVGSR